MTFQEESTLCLENRVSCVEFVEDFGQLVCQLVVQYARRPIGWSGGWPIKGTRYKFFCKPIKM